METQQRMEEAQKNLEDWIRNAVREAQKEVFEQEDKLEEKDLKRMKKVDQQLKESGGEGLWGSVNYNLYIADEEGTETVELETFGVPHIPEEIDIGDDKRQLYNDVLSDYGVALSQKVEQQFQEWKETQR